MIDGRKLKSLIDERGVLPAQISVILGYRTTDSVYKVFRNEIGIKDPEKIKKIAELLGVHPRELLRDDVLELAIAEGDAIYDSSFRIPVVGKVAAGAGEPLVFNDADMPVGYGAFGSVVLTELGQGSYAVLIDGDSMSPRFLPGETAIVDPTLPFESGKHHIIIANDGRKWVKRVIERDGGFILVPESSQYDPIELSNEEVRFIHRIRFLELR